MREEIVKLVQQLLGARVPNPARAAQVGDAFCRWEVKHPVRRGKREEYVALTGQRLYPAVELEDGRVIREESKDLVARIREGRLSA